MRYETPAALRRALDDRLLAESRRTGVSLDRLRRRVTLERILARLETAEPATWVLKGGMALEVRLGDRARLTRDIDVGLRAPGSDADALNDRLIGALAIDEHGDRFVFAAGRPTELTDDGGTWRMRIEVHLAGKPFGRVQLDVAPRPYELDATDVLTMPNSLSFAGVPDCRIEVVDLHRHAAEKVHAMLRDFGDRENSRVRDLVDLVLLDEHDLLDDVKLGASLSRVWAEREQAPPPPELPLLPTGWLHRYERLAGELGLAAATFEVAEAVVRGRWARATASTGPARRRAGRLRGARPPGAKTGSLARRAARLNS